MTLKTERTIAQLYKQYESRQSQSRFSCPADASPKRSFTYLGGRPPYGWISFDGKLIEYEPEQKIIRLIYQMTEDGYKPFQIADYLNRLGVPTKSGKAWAGHRLKHILKGVPETVVRQNMADLQRKEAQDKWRI